VTADEQVLPGKLALRGVRGHLVAWPGLIAPLMLCRVPGRAPHRRRCPVPWSCAAASEKESEKEFVVDMLHMLLIVATLGQILDTKDALASQHHPWAGEVSASADMRLQASRGYGYGGR
jgi:hypothetical protein